MEAYNKKLFNRFKNQISFVKSTFKGMDSFVLYFKSSNKVRALESDIKLLGFVSTKNLDQEHASIYQAVAAPGFGNVLYAFATMELSKEGKKICCNQEGDLSDDASCLWERIDKNEEYVRSSVPKELVCKNYIEHAKECTDDMGHLTNEEYCDIMYSGATPLSWEFSAFTCSPDNGYKIAGLNHKRSGMSPELVQQLMTEADRMFWAAFDEMSSDHENDVLRLDLSRDNYAQLESAKRDLDSHLSL